MQPLLRKAAAGSIRPRPRRAPPPPPAEAHPPRRLSLQAPARARTPAPPLSLCCRCWRGRAFSSSSSSGFSSNAMSPLVDGKARKSEPLRVLFCGSDSFSCAALEALYREHVRDPALVGSIDVVVRPGKRAGRGNRVVVHPPIRDLATKLGLPIHERDTFTGWDMPPHTNLIIAVSFGLFVPPRLLRSAAFGGLNVHPSLLPDLRGPAPLQHALLAGREHTGITLQTLDYESFDHGRILARTPALRIPPDCDYATLLETVTPVAAELLVGGLRDGVYVPHVPVLVQETEGEKGEEGGAVEVKIQGVEAEDLEGPLVHAPKITKADRQILPQHLPHLLRRYRALGSLWFWSRDHGGVRKRVIVERMSGTDSDLVPGDVGGASPGVPYLLPLEQDLAPDPDTSVETKDHNNSNIEHPKATQLVIWVPEDKDRDGACYLGSHCIETVKVEGTAARPAARALKDFLVPIAERDE
ncbi:Formyltransferase [Annulohypoxylon bovei var. microspora]|nr:Formyltransferase [Annulohypoxylon bovei var. microspora]